MRDLGIQQLADLPGWAVSAQVDEGKAPLGIFRWRVLPVAPGMKTIATIGRAIPPAMIFKDSPRLNQFPILAAGANGGHIAQSAGHVAKEPTGYLRGIGPRRQQGVLFLCTL